MYANDLTGTHVEMRSLRELLERKLPRLSAHMAALDCDMSLLATDWFLCLFATSLPAASAARVWDALLHEGPKVLFRVALAQLRLHEGVLLAQDNPGDLLRAARRCAAQAYDRDELMRVAFDKVGSLPMDTIRRHRARKQVEVDHEMAARETRVALRSAVAAGYVVQEGDEELLRDPRHGEPGPLGGGGTGAAPQAAGWAAGGAGDGGAERVVYRTGSGNSWKAHLQALGETLDRGKQRLAGSLHRRNQSVPAVAVSSQPGAPQAESSRH